MAAPSRSRLSLLMACVCAACAEPPVPSEAEAEYGAYGAALREEFGADTQTVVLGPQTVLANPNTPRGHVESLFGGMDSSLLSDAIAKPDVAPEDRFPPDIVPPVIVPQDRFFAVMRAGVDSVAPGAPGMLWLSRAGLNGQRDQALLSITQRRTPRTGSFRWVWLERGRGGWRVRDRAITEMPVDSATRAQLRRRMEAEMQARQNAPIRDVQAVEYEVYAAVLRSFVRDSAGDTGPIVIADRTNDYGPPMMALPDSVGDPSMLYDYTQKATNAAVDARFEGIGDYRLLSAAERRALFDDGPYAGWPRFYERFPDAAGLVELSRAGVSADGSRAVLHMMHMRGSVDGVARAVVLERTADGWEVVWTEVTGVA